MHKLVEDNPDDAVCFKGSDIMAKEGVKEGITKEIFKAIPYFIRFPVNKIWMDYDKEADVLYISFKRPQKATDSEMLKDGTLLRYKGEELVGITILDASKKRGG
ncbi:MAG: DUF2283 domain-containing protein [bacterium]